MFTATIYGIGSVFHAKVDYNKETVHPNSPHLLPESIIDERVPKEIFLSCNAKGQVAVFSERPKPVPPGMLVQKQVKAKYLQIQETWAIVPEPHGELVWWFENWAFIPCWSQAHAEHIINLLSQSHEKIPKDVAPVII